MFNPTTIVIDAFVSKLQDSYHRTYGNLKPDYPSMIAYIGRMALEKIANSDAPYHDLNHTIMVTEVGQEILRGRHLTMGGISPKDWLHFIISLLCHDIGYVRGICQGDANGHYLINEAGDTVTLKRGSTDAALTPYHVDRSKLFIKQRFGHVEAVDTDLIMRNIEQTRFPVPEKEDYRDTHAFPGLLRAADLIGQMADINYPRKHAALFAEFKETGIAEKLGYESAADLRTQYPKFFWGVVSPLIQDALAYLRETQEGQYWLAGLYSNVFAEEHQLASFGAERGPDAAQIEAIFNSA